MTSKIRFNWEIILAILFILPSCGQNNFNEKAVSNYSGKAIFTKIINNSTGSYINDKKDGYGPLEKYQVE